MPDLSAPTESAARVVVAAERAQAAQEALTPVAAIEQLSRVEALTDIALEESVAAARRDGRTWAEIGRAAGTSTSAAHTRWRHVEELETQPPRSRAVRRETRRGHTL